mgnify:CR=1 FL=1|tara:strand:- start:16008 stop:16607 length:600 start_codon:yes stop_codon:yes gene_type:complete
METGGDLTMGDKHWYDHVLMLEDVYNGTGSSVDETEADELDDRTIRARIKSFLDLIAWSEGTSTIRASDDGYNVIVGGGLFHDYSDHPRKLVDIPRYGIKSTAAGRYQILERYWDHYAKQLNLKDFTPRNQDKYAMNMFREVGCVKDIEDGRIEKAIVKCSSRWASFPGAGYGQREVEMKKMLDKFDDLMQDNLKGWEV